MKEEDGVVNTKLYEKPTDCNHNLHKSDHPRHVNEGAGKGQFRRIRRICSREEDYRKYGKQVQKKLMSRGYT